MLFESQRYVFSPLVSDWLFIYLVSLFCSIFLFLAWCSLFHWFYNFIVPKLFSSNILIIILTSFVFLFILISLDIFPIQRRGFRLVPYNSNRHFLIFFDKCLKVQLLLFYIFKWEYKIQISPTPPIQKISVATESEPNVVTDSPHKKSHSEPHHH